MVINYVIPEAKDHVLENNKNILHFICENYEKHAQIQHAITRSIIIRFDSHINKGDIDGLTPVHLACQFQHDFIKTLLESP